MLGTGQGLDMKHQNAPGRQRIRCCLFHAFTLFLVRGKEFHNLLEMKLPKLGRSSSSAEAAAAADDLSIVNVFVTGPPHTGMRRCVGTFLSLSEPEGLTTGLR